MPPLIYRTDGHKMVLIEGRYSKIVIVTSLLFTFYPLFFLLTIFFSFLKGIPTVFSWEHIEQFDGKKWVDAPFRLNESRSAFAVTTVPGHLVRGCK